MSRVRIFSEGHADKSYVYVDGKLLPDVVSVIWECDAGHPSRATIVIDRVDLEADVEDPAIVEAS